MSRFIALFALVLGPLSGETIGLYISAAPEGIYRADFDTDLGKLENLQSVAEFGGGGFLTFHPEKPLLYSTAGNREGGSLKAFAIKPDGSLGELNESSTGAQGTCQVSLDKKGTVALAANYGSGSVSSFLVKKDGTLSVRTGFSQHEGSSAKPDRQTSPHAHATVMGPDNRFAYVPDLGIDRVMIYAVDLEKGTLEGAGEGVLAPGSGPRHMKFSKDGKFAHVLNELSLTVTTFARNAETGALTEVGTVPVLSGNDWPEMTCAEIRIHPGGKFLYTSQRDLRTSGGEDLGRNSLSVFVIQPDGTLKRIQTVPAGVRIPRNFNLDPSGKWLVVGGQASNTVRVFKVAENGMLEATEGEWSCPGPICFEFRS